MDIASDILLLCGTLLVTCYCALLSRRLKKLHHLKGGLGAAITVLSSQVSDMTQTIDRANASARSNALRLQEITSKAEVAAKQLSLQMAALHDLPEANEQALKTPEPSKVTAPPFVRSNTQRTNK